MSDMWRSRDPPVPLDFDDIRNGKFDLPSKLSKPKTDGTSTTETAAKANVSISNGSSSRSSASTSTETLVNGSSSKQASSSLKDQRELTLRESLEMFVSR